ncbi:MAG: hypothetical protein HY885_11385 [Deltaproteobacteria bacterium]|nr:hypothetical protein [Deltaproteobacteria bacterium]
MKLSKDALSKIFKAFRVVYQKKDTGEPSAAWQNRLMEDIRRQPPVERRKARLSFLIVFFLLLIGFLGLFFLLLTKNP